MFVPKIVKICPTDNGNGLYIEWTTPLVGSKPGIAGYTLAYRRSDLDLNFSSETIIGGHISSHVISCSKSCHRYDIKISAFSFRDFGDFCPIVTWCSAEYGSNKSVNTDILPRPEIVKILSANQGSGIHIIWSVPVDPTSMIIEGFVIFYKRCGLDTQFKEKLIPGCNKRGHVITGTKRCALYDVRVAVCTASTRGKLSAPAIIRTGVSLPDSIKLKKTPVPQFKPQLTKISALYKPSGIFLSWTTPDQYNYPPVHGYVIAYRKVSAYESPYFKCYVTGAQSAKHIITGVRANVPHEIKVAAYNSCGVGQFTMPKLVYRAEERVIRRAFSSLPVPSVSLTQRSMSNTACLVY